MYLVFYVKKTHKNSGFLKMIQLNNTVGMIINAEMTIPSSKDNTITPRLENLGFQST